LRTKTVPVFVRNLTPYRDWKLADKLCCFLIHGGEAIQKKVLTVLALLNMYISRVTYTQIKEGIKVSKENLKPGDLVFFGTFKNPHHVGIYFGNGIYIHV
jgi:hypothetical protein